MTPQDFKLVYYGSPYSKFDTGIHNAFVEVAAKAADLMRQGVKVYSPIAHTHPLAIYGNIDPLDHNIWLPFDEAMMDACEAMIIADMAGWDTSYGVQYEIKHFRERGKPVFKQVGDKLLLYPGS